MYSFKLSYLLLSLLILISGCDFLSYNENDNFSKEDTFQDYDRTKNFLNNIYRQLPDGFNEVGNAMRASATDDAEEILSERSVQEFNDGSWSAINLLDNRWEASYSAIRAANIFIEEFDITNFTDRQYNDDYDQMIEQAELFPTQARFLRAFFYFDLIKRYGNVPLIREALNPEEVNSVTPSTHEEVTAFIVSELDAIIPDLPVDYQSVPGSETGRATKGAAMALKSRVLLYAASPLHNSSADVEKWVSAAEAANAVIDLGEYALEPNYSDIMNNRTSDELIFERRLPNSNSFERINFPIGYEGSNPGTAPTQNLVDAYEMQTTGLSINDPGSGYDSSNPYEDRDPRLTQTVIVNNSTWKGRSVETWTDGRDGPPQEQATRTGYYLKKGVIESINLDPANTTSAIHTWVFLRYGGILLDYAEAMNEAYGPEADPEGYGMTAREAVNEVRDRSNMPEFSTGMSQSDFREKLHNERRVELAFEDHRFWDIRRWEIGPSTTDIYGMEITRNGDGSFTYSRELIEERVWDNRMYLYPIPQNEVFVNDNIEQNPGWGN